MLVGLNYPWSHNLVGAQIGPYPWVDRSQWIYEQDLAQKGDFSKIKPAPLFNRLDTNLRHLANMKIAVIRFFLLANGFNYGPAPTGGYSNWSFAPPKKADPRFAFDFEKLLQSCASAGVKIVPSLISFEFGSNRQPDIPANGSAAGGRYDCITDEARQKTFLTTLLGDLLGVSKKKEYAEVIYCWEVINEPYWDTSYFGADGRPQSAHVSDSQMNRFLGAATKLIEDAGFLSTVGHRFYSDLSQYVTGKLPQFHYYAKTVWIPGVVSPLLSPSGGLIGDPILIKGGGLFKRNPKPFLGEFDSDFNLHSKPWPGLSAAEDTTFNRLKVLEGEGCELALIWPDRPANKADEPAINNDDQVKLQQRTRQQIVQFTGGVVDPGTW